MLIDTPTYVAGSDWGYDITGSTLSAPSDGDIIMRFKATRAFKLPTNLSGSQMSADVAPSSNATFTVQKNNASVGTFQIDTNGTLVSPTFTEASFATGDTLEVEATTANAIDEVFITFKTVAV